MNHELNDGAVPGSMFVCQVSMLLHLGLIVNVLPR